MTSSPTVRFLDRTSPPHISTLILLAGLSALNMSIFLPSLNDMAVYFDTSYATMQLSVSGYLAATAILQIFVGPIADRFGRRQVALWSIGIFVAATIGAMLATSATMFLAFRMLQAVVATTMVLSRAIVRDMFPQDQAASMIGYVTMGMALVPMIGPMIGGGLAQLFGWQACFVFLALAGLLVLALCYLDQGETVAGGGMSFGDQVKSYPALLASPRFWGYAAAAAFGSGAFFALLGGASFVSGEIFHLSPVWAGVALGAPAIGYALGNFLVGRFTVRVGLNMMALLGMLVSTIALGVSLVITLMGHTSPLLFFGFCTFLGLGNGMMLPNVTAGMLSVRPHLAGTASGLGGAIMIGGGAALSQIAGVVMTVESGTWPLQVLMVGSLALGVVAIIYVIQREKRLRA